MFVHAIVDKKGGCVAIDHRLDARTPHPTYVCLPQIAFLDFWWRPFLHKKICRCYPSVLLKMVVHAIFDKNVCCVAIDHRLEARS
jgi:hypothetical protein